MLRPMHALKLTLAPRYSKRPLLFKSYTTQVIQ